jgi:hypothetical protein
MCIGQQDVAVEKSQNQCHRACFTLEIAPQLPCRELGRLHDVADHYIFAENASNALSQNRP